MPLSCTSPSGFRFLTIVSMLAALTLSLAKALVDHLPEPPLIQFCVINMMGFFLFLTSLYLGRRLKEPKSQWLNNAFAVSGVVLTLYSGTVEVEGSIKSSFVPLFYIVEIVILIWITKKFKLQADRYIELAEVHPESKIPV